jgi:Flp pilus assembly protein TadG
MMSKLAGVHRRFIDSTRGVAAIEFAMIMPVLLVLFLGSFDGGRAIAIYMKVRTATYALASIANQYTTIHDTDMTSILGATSAIVAPYSSTPLSVTISELTVTSSGKATVTWSNGSPSSAARTVGSTVTVSTGLGGTGTALVFAEVNYQFTPMFGYLGKTSITLADNLYTTPRSSGSIARTSP